MRDAPHPGRAGGRRVGDRGGSEGRLQGLQPARAKPWSSGCRRSAARRPRARVVHLRPAERPRRDVRRHRGAGRAGRRDLRAVRDADAVSRHRRLRELGEAKSASQCRSVDGVPLTRHWLIPQARRPKVYAAHPTMSADEIRARTQAVWDRFYSAVAESGTGRGCVKSLRARLAFVLISKLYRQMYANTGIATDSARVSGRPSGRAGSRPLPPAVHGGAHAAPAGATPHHRTAVWRGARTVIDHEALGGPPMRVLVRCGALVAGLLAVSSAARGEDGARILSIDHFVGVRSDRAGDRRAAGADLRARARARRHGAARRIARRSRRAVRARRGNAGRSRVRRALSGLQLDGVSRARRASTSSRWT